MRYWNTASGRAQDRAGERIVEREIEAGRPDDLVRVLAGDDAPRRPPDLVEVDPAERAALVEFEENEGRQDGARRGIGRGADPVP